MSIVDFLTAAEEPFFFLASAIVVGVSIANFVTRRFQRMPCDRRRRYAVYCGRQEGFAGGDGFTLWTLTDHRLGFKGSTVDERWLDEAIEARMNGDVLPQGLAFHSAYLKAKTANSEHGGIASCTAGERLINGKRCTVQVAVVPRS